MENCPKCGAERPQNAVECPQCGVIYARYEGKLADEKRAQEQARREMLTTCPACGKEISKNAVSCPNCGEPMQVYIQPVQATRYEEIQPPPGKTTIKTILKWLGIIAACAVGVGIYAEISTPGKIGKKTSTAVGEFQVQKNTLGCKRIDDYKNIAKLSNDREAFKKQVLLSVAAGACALLPEGKTANIEESRMFDGAVRVRVLGETESYWIQFEMAKSAK